VGQSSFNLVSLFATGLMKEAFNLMSCHFKKNILALLHDVLNPSNFRFGGQSCYQTDGISMGLLLSPVIADSHTEDS
jgi:Sec7-like guanine-nucleotide exchange factor